MTTILAAAALLCGIPIGFVVGVVLGATIYRKREEDEFDGGFSVDHEAPKARTTIWYGEGDRQ